MPAEFQPAIKLRPNQKPIFELRTAGACRLDLTAFCSLPRLETAPYLNRMWSIALRTLIADRGKLATALVGVVFSVVLVNVQGGLFIGLLVKVALLADADEADIWGGHEHVHNIDFPLDIPKRWMYRVRAVPGVAAAAPYMIGYINMTLPSGGFEGVVIARRCSVTPGTWIRAALRTSAKPKTK